MSPMPRNNGISGSSNSQEKLEQMGWESDESVSYVPQRRRLAQPTFDNGDWSAVITHMEEFKSHVIIARPGQDIAAAMLLLTTQHSPRGICIMSGTGEISSVELGNLDPAVAGTTKHEGRFDIIRLSGNFIPYYGQGTTGGGIHVVLVDQSDPEQRTISGPVRGCLKAASPVQIVLGTFLPSKPIVIPEGAPMPELEAVAPTAATAPAAAQAPRAEEANTGSAAALASNAASSSK